MLQSCRRTGVTTSMAGRATGAKRGTNTRIQHSTVEASTALLALHSTKKYTKLEANPKKGNCLYRVVLV